VTVRTRLAPSDALVSASTRPAQPAHHVLDVDQHIREGIVDLVGDTGGECSERAHPILADGSGLRSVVPRHVERNHAGADDRGAVHLRRHPRLEHSVVHIRETREVFSGERSPKRYLGGARSAVVGNEASPIRELERRPSNQRSEPP